MPFKRRYKDKYAGNLRERICCPNSVRLVFHCFHSRLLRNNLLSRCILRSFFAFFYCLQYLSLVLEDILSDSCHDLYSDFALKAPNVVVYISFSILSTAMTPFMTLMTPFSLRSHLAFFILALLLLLSASCAKEAT